MNGISWNVIVYMNALYYDNDMHAEIDDIFPV